MILNTFGLTKEFIPKVSTINDESIEDSDFDSGSLVGSDFPSGTTVKVLVSTGQY